VWVVRDNYYAQSRQWTLKPKEQPVEDFKVGDRVTNGQRQGTVSYKGHPYIGVLWDWGGVSDYCTNAPLPFTKLPKLEPTLAELGLKVGDCFQWEGHNRIVTAVCADEITSVNATGGVMGFRLSNPARYYKKLEVPK